MKKSIIIFVCVLMLGATVLFCFGTNKTIQKDNDNSNNAPTPSTTQNETKDNFEEGIDGKTTLDNLSVALISYNTATKDNIGYTMNELPNDKISTITLLLYSKNNSIPINQIESIEIKTKGGSALNGIEENHFTLNNKKACVIFVKTELDKKPEQLSVSVKTYDGNTKNYEIPDIQDKKIASVFATEANDAKNGDLIRISGKYYFILESGIFESQNISYNGINYCETRTGTLLIPLDNTFYPTLSEDNFDVVFYGENGSNDDYGVKVDPTVNNKEMVQKYSKKFFGLYGELLTCDYRLELDKQDSEKHVDYMVKNSWYKIKTDENQLLKICNQ